MKGRLRRRGGVAITNVHDCKLFKRLTDSAITEGTRVSGTVHWRLRKLIICSWTI